MTCEGFLHQPGGCSPVKLLGFTCLFWLCFRCVQILNTTDVWLMPSLNPDGFERAGEGQCGVDGNYNEFTFGRTNARGKDLNRNFPDQFRDAHLLTQAHRRSHLNFWPVYFYGFFFCIFLHLP